MKTSTLPELGRVRLWCHAETVTQTSAMAELVVRCSTEMPELTALITTGSAEATDALSAASLGNNIHCFPFDAKSAPSPKSVSADTYVWAGNEDSTYPLVMQAGQRSQLILVDVAASQTNRFGLRPSPTGQRSALQNCTRAYAKDSAAVDWMVGQGMSRNKIRNLGPLRPGVAIPPCDEDLLADYASLTSARPIWLCTQFCDAEKNHIVSAHRRACRSAHKLLLVISPSQQDTGPQIADWFDAEGFKTGCHSRGEEPESDTQIFVADGAEDLFVWFRLAAISYIGGSLSDSPVDNPYWPAALGSVVVHGSHAGQHATLFQHLRDGQASVTLSSPDALGRVIKQLLSPHSAAELAHNAWQVTSAGADLIDALAEEVLETLDLAQGAN